MKPLLFIAILISTNTLLIMNATGKQTQTVTDNSKKSILARGCDPYLSAQATKWIPPLIGNPEYVATTDDVEFFEKLKSQKWSIIYFAPGACRYDAAKRPIPGGNIDTQGWGLDEYKAFIYKHQGEQVQIVETPQESEALDLLKDALDIAVETR